MTHICVSRLTVTGSDNGLSPGRRQAIIWTNAGILLIGPLGTNFSENLIEILTFSLTKMQLKVSSAKWRPFCLGHNVLRMRPHGWRWVMVMASRKFEFNLRYVIFKQILVIDGWGISCEIALIWMTLDFTDDKSALVQVMAWCRQATSHCLSQCWPRSLLPYGVTGPQVKLTENLVCFQTQLHKDTLAVVSAYPGKFHISWTGIPFINMD